MKKLLLLVALFSMALGVQARKVAFRVDMTGQTVSANGVHIAGNFKNIDDKGVDENPNLVNWNPAAYALTANGNIYTYVLDLAPGLPYEFKFVNDNNWGAGEESIPAASKVSSSNGNRWVYIPASTATDTLMLAPIMFSGNAPAGQKLVRLNVDMAKVTAVSTNGVHLAGNLVEWDPAKFQMANYKGNGEMSGTVYQYMAYVTTGASPEYKFINGNTWGDSESVPSACKIGDNRFLTTINTDTIISKVCFGSCTACPSGVIPKFNATFRVDMATATACAIVDSVDVAGGVINGWAGGSKLTPVSAGSSIYSITIALDSGEVEYKFRKITGTNVKWEGLANRKFMLKKDTVLGIVCFDETTACTPVPATANVRFMVDLSNEIPNANGDIFVMGNFTEPNWQAGAIKMTPIAGQIGLYETTFLMCPGTFYFKFSNGPVSNDANGESFPDTLQRGCNEPNGVGGFNRVYTRPDGTAKQVGFVFNSCVQVSVGINNSLNANNIKLYPNPTESNAIIAFNDLAKNHTVVVSDITGRIIDTYSNVIEKQMTINSNNYSTGMYFVQITNEMNETATVKLAVK
jgi:hypothetical protein